MICGRGGRHIPRSWPGGGGSGGFQRPEVVRPGDLEERRDYDNALCDFHKV